MARRRQRRITQNPQGWVITFSDMMTLVLTFFVLLISMSSMDTSVITKISAHFSSSAFGTTERAGRQPERVIEVVQLLQDQQNIIDKQQRIKDLLFPYDILPPEVTTGDLQKNIKILAHPEGVVIVLTDQLLFAPRQTVLQGSGKKLLDMLTPVILSLHTGVNISGHADAQEGNQEECYRLGSLRAIAVLEYFLQSNISPNRFSISTYGADKPAEQTVDGAKENQRIEILLKTEQWAGRYI